MKRNNLISAGSAAVAGVAAVAMASAATPTALVGTWGKTVTESTWTKHHVPGEPGGHFAIAVAGGGVTSMYYGADPTQTKATIFPFTTMRATVTGRHVTFSPTTDGACPGKGSYSWSASGGKLSFTLVKDDCDARRVLMTAGPFVLESR